MMLWISQLHWLPMPAYDPYELARQADDAALADAPLESRPGRSQQQHLRPHMVEAPPEWPQGAVFVDVRSYAEFMAGHLPGAHCLPLPRLTQDVANWHPDPEQPMVVYCATGARAELALTELRRLGYERAVYGGSAMALSQRLGLPLQQGM